METQTQVASCCNSWECLEPTTVSHSRKWVSWVLIWVQFSFDSQTTVYYQRALSSSLIQQKSLDSTQHMGKETHSQCFIIFIKEVLTCRMCLQNSLGLLIDVKTEYTSWKSESKQEYFLLLSQVSLGVHSWRNKVQLYILIPWYLP